MSNFGFHGVSLFLRKRRLLSSQFGLGVFEHALKMDNSRIVVFERLLGVCEPGDFRCDVVMALSKVEFYNTQPLLDGHQFIVAFSQFIPSDQHLIDELLERVAFEHPFERCALIVG